MAGTGVIGGITDQLKTLQQLPAKVNNVIAQNNSAPPLWTDSLDGSTSSSSGGGGYYTPAVDHFYDVSPVDQANIDQGQQALDEQAKQDAFNDQLATAKQKWQQAQDTANLALSQGNLALAAQQQNSANYWQGISSQLQQQQVNLTNQGQQLDYASQMANIQQAREASNNNLQLGLANATNDADRNAITAKWNQEQAAIAKMQDETQRVLGGQQNQTSQYNAETQRQGTMGNLALENNKFLLNAATSPSDLWALWFMQRGITPDWQTITNGGTPAQGTPLVPINPMTAFTPTTAAPTFNGTPQNSAAAAVGQATASYSPQANPFLAAGLPDISQPLNYFNGSFLPYNQLDLSGQPAPADVTPYITQTSNVGGVHGGGVPLSSLQPGNNPYTVSGTTRGSDFTMPTYYDEGHTRQVQAGDTLADGQQVYINYQPNTTQSQYDNTGPNAALSAAQAQLHSGAPASLGTNPGGLMVNQSTPAMATGGMTRAPQFIVGDQPSGVPTGHEEMVYNPTNAPVKVIPFQRFGDFMMKIPRYAMGTDASAQYQATGFGDLWQPTSGNSYLNGQALPQDLQALGNAGVPLPPGVVAASTGQISPTLNMGSAFTQRGIGVAPSLQTVNGMTKSEADNYKGYIQGVGGVPWDDFIDWLGTPTQNLQAAQRSRAA